jgi:hypothetical protein
MRLTSSRTLLALLCVLAMGACERTRPAERTGAAIDRAGTNTGQALGRAADDTGRALNRAADDTGAALNRAGDWVRNKTN